MVKASVELVFGVLLNFVHESKWESDCSNFERKHPPSLAAQYFVEQFHFMTKTDKRNINCPEANFDRIANTLKIVIFIDKPLRQVLYQLIFSVVNLL